MSRVGIGAEGGDLTAGSAHAFCDFKYHFIFPLGPQEFKSLGGKGRSFFVDLGFMSQVGVIISVNIVIDYAATSAFSIPAVPPEYVVALA